MHEQPSSEFLRTPTGVAIWNTLNYAQERACLAAILGAGGIGKTFTVDAYAAENPKVHVIQGTPRIRTAKQLLEELERQVFTGTCTVSETELFRVIRREPRSLLVIDEAQFLTDGGLELLRSLNDPGRGWNGKPDWSGGFMIGIALVGNPVVVSQREGKNRSLYSQLLTRFRPRLILGASLMEDYEVLFDHHNIAGAPSRKRIQAVADRKEGGLRTATFIIERAQEIAGDQPVTLDHIQEAVTFLGYH